MGCLPDYIFDSSLTATPSAAASLDAIPSVAPVSVPPVITALPSSAPVKEEVVEEEAGEVEDEVAAGCEFCSENNGMMYTEAVIPFSDGTTCAMAKDVVVQLSSTSEDCDLARKAEAICCPKPTSPPYSSISPSSSMDWTTTTMPTPAPTISFGPTKAPVQTASSETAKSDGGDSAASLPIGVSSCLVAATIMIAGLQLF